MLFLPFLPEFSSNLSVLKDKHANVAAVLAYPFAPYLRQKPLNIRRATSGAVKHLLFLFHVFIRRSMIKMFGINMIKILFPDRMRCSLYIA